MPGVRVGKEGGSPSDTDFERSSRHGPRIKGLAICSHWIDLCPVAITNGKCSAKRFRAVPGRPSLDDHATSGTTGRSGVLRCLEAAQAAVVGRIEEPDATS